MGRGALGYDSRMRSVADQLREQDRARMGALSPEQRVALSLRLGEAGVRVLCAARGVSREEAVKLARALRSRGRRASGSAAG